MDPKEVQNVKPLTSKWVFKVKQDGKYKARLVIRGCEQRYGVDFEETYSPVVSTTALRILFALTTIRNYKMVTFDIKTAFLYGNLNENIYMYLPEGYNHSNKICRLNKALYGLKQASFSWNQRFSNFLKKKGFKQLKTEPCLFIGNNRNLILGIYVDDGILVGESIQEINNLLEELKGEFQVTIEKDPKSFVGMEIEWEEDGLKLTQSNYAMNVLKRYRMEDQLQPQCKNQMTNNKIQQ